MVAFERIRTVARASVVSYGHFVQQLSFEIDACGLPPCSAKMIRDATCPFSSIGPFEVLR